MPAYTYEAITKSGATERGVVEADSERAAKSQLRAQSLIPLKLALMAQDKPRSPGDVVLWQARAFSRTDLVVWTRQLASLVGAGLPLERALSALSDEAPTPAQRDLVAQVRAEVNAGAPLAQALAQHPREFDNLYTAVIEAGEQSGRLGAVLLQLAKDQESAHAMRSKLLAASLYPAIVSGVALLIVLFLLAYVVPQVAQVFTSTQRSLPALTIAMLFISEVVQATWLAGLVLLLAGMVVLRLLLRQTAFRLAYDQAWLKLPLLGRLSLGYNAARFASTLALLVGAGVPILKALQTAAHTLSNMALREHAMQAIDLVREGAPLASALAQNKRLPGVLSMFARLGEQTGQLPQMLTHAAEHLGEEVQRRAMQLATVLEPLLIVTMGLVVMLIVLAVMLPIIELNQFVQ
ncbi:MAG: type II secretion system F family protein [Burkholderiales bacterium]|nr:type II secretion system F family protein [Burkholderiales bacterium]